MPDETRDASVPDADEGVPLTTPEMRQATSPQGRPELWPEPPEQPGKGEAE